MIQTSARVGALLATIALAACGGGGSSNPTPPAPNGPSQKLPQSNGQPFTLASCVPVTDDLTIPFPTVGAACGGIAPAPPSTAWTVNGRTDVRCLIVTDVATGNVIGFQCDGNPYG